MLYNTIKVFKWDNIPIEFEPLLEELSLRAQSQYVFFSADVENYTNEFSAFEEPEIKLEMLRMGLVRWMIEQGVEVDETVLIIG